jgi:hypothetical protein
MNSREIPESTEKLHSYTTRLSAPAWPAWIILISNEDRVSVVAAGCAMAAAAAAAGGRGRHAKGWAAR